MVPQILPFWNKLSNREQTSHCLVMMRERFFFPPFIMVISAQCTHTEAETPRACYWTQHAQTWPCCFPPRLFHCLRRMCACRQDSQRTWETDVLKSSAFPSNVLLLPQKNPFLTQLTPCPKCAERLLCLSSPSSLHTGNFSDRKWPREKSGKLVEDNKSCAKKIPLSVEFWPP